MTFDHDAGVTWKSVFDGGFRPKHQVGLESTNCICKDQAFLFKRAGSDVTFSLGKGRLLFELRSDDSIRMIWHQGSESIDHQEANRRVDAFRALFADVGVQKREGYNLVATIGEYRIHYGFDPSCDDKKPLVPHFYVFKTKERGESRPPGEKVTPPAGYEWYLLSPNLEQYSPGVNELKPQRRRGPREKKSDIVNASQSQKNLLNGVAPIALIIGLLLAPAVIFFLYRRSNHATRQ